MKPSRIHAQMLPVDQAFEDIENNLSCPGLLIFETQAIAKITITEIHPVWTALDNGGRL